MTPPVSADQQTERVAEDPAWAAFRVSNHRRHWTAFRDGYRAALAAVGPGQAEEAVAE